MAVEPNRCQEVKDADTFFRESNAAFRKYGCGGASPCTVQEEGGENGGKGGRFSCETLVPVTRTDAQKPCSKAPEPQDTSGASSHWKVGLICGCWFVCGSGSTRFFE